MTKFNQPQTPDTKRRLSGLAAFGACAACCAVPLLAVAGMSGGLSAVASYLRPSLDLVFAGSVGLGVSAVLMVAMRARKGASAGCEVACDREGGCGCGPSKETTVFRSSDPAQNEPVVCTADLDDEPRVRAHLDGYRAAFVHLRGTERFEGGFRWIFATAPGLVERLETLAENEHRCCRFFEFEVRTSGNSVIWETRGDERSLAVVEEFANLPARLAQNAAGEDVAVLKEGIGRAGLVFASDSKPPR
jgi:hypothetical protein